MSLSAEFVNAHIRKWEAQLRGVAYAHRALWPSRLFHHAPLENAVSILRSGRLLSRLDSGSERLKDVAAREIIGLSSRAHQFARFYFRPRTPTQYHIEGIRRDDECQFGSNAHAPILIMFVFDARRILCDPEVRFSGGNMQSGLIELSLESEFEAIPFEKVYHEGGAGWDSSIKHHRCAEVLLPSPFVFGDCLQWIYCRSSAERTFLVDQLGDLQKVWLKKIKISDDLKVFEKRHSFVENISLSLEGVTFNLNPRFDGSLVRFNLRVWDEEGFEIINYDNTGLAARPETAANWIFRHRLEAGRYVVEVKLEGRPAFRGPLSISNQPF